MKSLILLVSYHHGNTRKVAEKAAEVLGADIREPGKIQPEDLKDYDLVGFASGVYFGKMEKRLISFAEKLPKGNGKRIFIVTTSGSSHEKAHEGMVKALVRKGYVLAGEWNCRAFDTFGPLALIGGINKGKPTEDDLASVKRFAESLAQPT